MNITAETPEEKILAPIEAAKAALVTFATEQVGQEIMNGERLVGLAQNVRTAEDLAHVQIQYRNVCVNRPENRLFFLLSQVTRRDDTWSGRQNDSRRSSMDAIASWAADQALSIRSERV